MENKKNTIFELSFIKDKLGFAIGKVTIIENTIKLYSLIGSIQRLNDHDALQDAHHMAESILNPDLTLPHKTFAHNQLIYAKQNEYVTSL